MKTPLATLCALLLVMGSHSLSEKNSVVYQSPLPGSEYILPQTTIILRPGGTIDPSSVSSQRLFQVDGSASGSHDGVALLSDDQQTVIFMPSNQFALGETVSVALHRGLKTVEGQEIEPIQFLFYTTGRSVGPDDIDVLNALEIGEQARTFGPDTLPAGFPSVTATTYGQVAPGNLFLANFRFAGSSTPFLMILDNAGDPVFYRQMERSALDFRLQSNGLLTYYDSFRRAYYALDDSYTVVDSFRCGNGYSTDNHGLFILPNGHALLMNYDPQTVDMSDIVPGGDPQATVIGFVIQELDLQRNVVFQWRSWDYFSITDATHENLLAQLIDYVHGNAIEPTRDGNLLISSRHLDEITKIDRTTGDIIWRLGGKNSDFVFLNDSIGFSHQHSPRDLPNGNLLLYDNGNFHEERVSRAVEYELDERARTATLVWQYRNPENTYGGAMGSVQRLSNGNTLIGWGSTNPTATEVNAQGERVFELTFEPGMFSYRAFRFEWNVTDVEEPSVQPTSVALVQNYPNPFNGSTAISFHLNHSMEVTLKVYDVLGREVQGLLQNDVLSAGTHTVHFDGTDLSSGTYFYRLTVPGHFETRKLMLLR